MEVYVTSGGEPKQALQIGGRLGGKEIENQLRFSLDIQYFAKNSRDYMVQLRYQRESMLWSRMS